VEVGIFQRGLVILSANFRWKGTYPPTSVGVRKLELLLFHRQYLIRFVTKHASDGRADSITVPKTVLASIAASRFKNRNEHRRERPAIARVRHRDDPP